VFEHCEREDARSLTREGWRRSVAVPVDLVEVSEAPQLERYELRVGGELAGILEFRGHGDPRALTHTEVLTAFEGRGLASELVRAVMADMRAKGLHVLPICPYVKAWLGRHPEEIDLVLPRHRAAFGLVT
jgi:uncharacterized protein